MIVKGKCGLPDIYTQSLRVAGLRAEGIQFMYIRQTTSDCVTTNIPYE